jgi:3-oxoacyl-(acyl-carrier-protein) synthase
MVRFDRETWQEGPRFVDATLFPNTVINSPAGFVSIFFGLGGPNTTIADGAASSLAALDYASTLLRRGRADAVLAGGFEELSPWVFLGLHNAGRLAVTGGEGGGSVPFARGRSGIAPGEGAAFLRLAASSSEPLAWITGQAAASAPGSLRAPQALDAAAARSAMVLAMRGALQSAGLGPEQVDAVWASAGGQPVLDALAAQALAEVFGARTAVLPVVAVKGALGECYGAAGALQVAAAVRGLQEGLLPPTAGEAPPDPDLGLGGLAARPRSLAAQHVLVNAFDGLGNNRSLVLSRAS